MLEDTHVVLPIAGEGKRFAEKGYTFPKYLVSVRGKPVIQWVIESLQLPQAVYHIGCRSEDIKRFHLDDMFGQLVGSYTLHGFDQPTHGAACTVLELMAGLKGELPVLVANCDQWVTWDPQRVFEEADEWHADAAIMTFQSVHPKWSFVEVDQTGRWVRQVAEKRPISPWATCGLYWARQAWQLRSCIEEMMRDPENLVNNEWYLAPAFNEYVEQQWAVMAAPVEEMWSLGTPEDLEEFRQYIIGSGA